MTENISNTRYFSKKEIVLRTQKSKRLLILLVSHIFGGILIYDNPQGFISAFTQFSMSTLFYGLFIVIALPFAWYHYLDNKPKLIISETGIMIENKDFYEWGMIVKANVIEKTYGWVKYFLILTVKYGNALPEEIKTEITYLDMTPEEIHETINTYKKN